jgi:orotate phosphoribosyltransferase
VIVDDVITAGTSIRESVATIGAAGAKPAGVLIALDRMERGQGESSAVQDIRDTFGIPVVSIATLDDVMTFIDSRSDLARMRPAIADYRARYGTH